MLERPSASDPKARRARAILVLEDAAEAAEPGQQLDAVFGAGNWTAIEFAELVVEKGAGEILLTSMDRDGTKAGFDLELTKAVSDAVRVPVIASGGVGALEHLAEGVAAGASAVLAASIFHFGEYTIGEAKAALAASGAPVRPVET